MSSSTCVNCLQDDHWASSVACSKCLSLIHVKCITNEASDSNTATCRGCSDIPKLQKSGDNHHEYDQSCDDEDKEQGQESFHYTAKQSTPTCITITTNCKFDKVPKTSSRKRRNKGKEDQKKVKKRYEMMDLKQQSVKTLSFSPAKVRNSEILYKELSESSYSCALGQALAKLDANTIKSNPFPQADMLKNMKTRKLTVLHSEQNRLFTINDIDDGEAIIELKGNYILGSEFLQLPHHASLNSNHPRAYMFAYQGLEGLDVVVDSKNEGNLSRFCRFSTTPNAGLRHVWWDNDTFRLYLFASNSMMGGEEITLPLHYSVDHWMLSKEEERADATSGNIEEKKLDDRRLSPIKLTIPKSNQQFAEDDFAATAAFDDSGSSARNSRAPTGAAVAPRSLSNQDNAKTTATAITDPPVIKGPKRKGRRYGRKARETQPNPITQLRPPSPINSGDNPTNYREDDSTRPGSNDHFDQLTIGDYKTIKIEPDISTSVKRSKMKKYGTASKVTPSEMSQMERFTVTTHIEDYVFAPGSPPDGNFLIDIQVDGSASRATLSNVSALPKKHFLEKALSDTALVFDIEKVTSDDDKNCTSSFHKKRLMKRYLKEEGSTALSSSFTADKVEGATLADQLDDSSLGDSSALRIEAPLIPVQYPHLPDVLFGPLNTSAAANFPCIPSPPAKKKVSLTEYLRRKKKPKSDESKPSAASEAPPMSSSTTTSQPASSSTSHMPAVAAAATALNEEKSTKVFSARKEPSSSAAASALSATAELKTKPSSISSKQSVKLNIKAVSRDESLVETAVVDSHHSVVKPERLSSSEGSTSKIPPSIRVASTEPRRRISTCNDTETDARLPSISLSSRKPPPLGGKGVGVKREERSHQSKFSPSRNNAQPPTVRNVSGMSTISHIPVRVSSELAKQQQRQQNRDMHQHHHHHLNARRRDGSMDGVHSVVTSLTPATIPLTPGKQEASSSSIVVVGGGSTYQPRLNKHKRNSSSSSSSSTSTATTARNIPVLSKQQQQQRKMLPSTSSSSPLQRATNRSSCDSLYKRARLSPSVEWLSGKERSLSRDETSSAYSASSIFDLDEYSRHRHHEHFDWDKNSSSSSSTFTSPTSHHPMPSDQFTYAPAPSRSSPLRRSPPPALTTTASSSHHGNSSPFRRHNTPAAASSYYSSSSKRASSSSVATVVSSSSSSGGGETSDKSKYYYDTTPAYHHRR